MTLVAPLAAPVLIGAVSPQSVQSAPPQRTQPVATQAAQPAPPAAGAAGARPKAAESQPATPEERLWARIVTRYSEAPTMGGPSEPGQVPSSQPAARPQPGEEPGEPWFRTAIAQRQALLADLRTYEVLFPGGAHRDEAIRLELASLFEVGALADGAFAPLSERVAELLQNPPSDDSLAEAAYWQIICDRLRRGAAGTLPAATRPAEGTASMNPAAAAAPGFDGQIAMYDADLLARYEAYCERFPSSRYCPRMLSALFEVAWQRQDRAALGRITQQLRQYFPQDLVTRDLAALVRRLDTLGQPFSVSFTSTIGKKIDTGTLRGSRVVILVWSAFDPDARAIAEQASRLAAKGSVKLVGVALDADIRDTDLANARMPAPFPQWNDGFGWGHTFCRDWGVRVAPAGFLIDEQGRLAEVLEPIDAAGLERWMRP